MRNGMRNEMEWEWHMQNIPRLFVPACLASAAGWQAGRAKYCPPRTHIEYITYIPRVAATLGAKCRGIRASSRWAVRHGPGVVVPALISICRQNCAESSAQ